MITRKIVALAFTVFAVAALSGMTAGVVKAEANTDIEVGFSPDGTGEALVLKTIHSAKKSIRLAAYSFTSATVTKALIEAKKRGVNVAVVVDYKNNIQQDRSGKARAALNTLSLAGIPIRTVSVFPIQHSKYAVIDGESIQTGSFNYSQAAAKHNSENVMVIHDRPDLGHQYLQNWQAIFESGQPYTSTYD